MPEDTSTRLPPDHGLSNGTGSTGEKPGALPVPVPVPSPRDSWDTGSYSLLAPRPGLPAGQEGLGPGGRTPSSNGHPRVWLSVQLCGQRLLPRLPRSAAVPTGGCGTLCPGASETHFRPPADSLWLSMELLVLSWGASTGPGLDFTHSLIRQTLAERHLAQRWTESVPFRGLGPCCAPRVTDHSTDT